MGFKTLYLGFVRNTPAPGVSEYPKRSAKDKASTGMKRHLKDCPALPPLRLC